MKYIVLNDSDIPYVKQIYNKIIYIMNNMPIELMKNERFGAWIVTATANIFCGILKIMELNKDIAFKVIEDIWDNQGNINKILN